MFEVTHIESLVALSSATLVGYLSCLTIYRLFLHPLRDFPGDRLAALTTWHWDYHASESDYLDKQHARYGPIVRICPNELHFSSPEVYHEIYRTGSKFTKDPYFYASFAQDESSFSLRDPRESKTRRDIMSPLFSRRAIFRLEGVIQEQVDILVNQVLSYQDRPVDLHHAFRSTTLDVISSYCFGQPILALSYPGFRHPILIAMESSSIIWVAHAFPFLVWLLFNMPDRLIVLLNPSMKYFLFVRAKLAGQIEQLLADPESLDRADRETVYHHLLTPHPEKGQLSVPSKKSLLDEALALMFAGSDTVGNACVAASFHVLNNKSIYDALVQELRDAWPEKDVPVLYETLEKLPYLTAVIKEALRFSHGAVSPLPRAIGPDPADIGGIHVPAGTTISSTATFVHNNPEIFYNPQEFDPNRWLQANSRELENYLVPFSKGPRACLGINLAWCELYLIIGNLFRKVEMEVHNTTVDDFKYRACFLPVFTGRPLHAMVRPRKC